MAPPTNMEEERHYRRCLIGGTFDRFHSGHQLLIQTALRQADFIEVHVTNDAMAQAKGGWIESLEDRMEGVLSWLSVNAPKRHEVFVFEHPHGPAPHNQQADSIVETE